MTRTIKSISAVIIIAFGCNNVSSQTIYVNEDFSTGSVTTPPIGWTQNLIFGDSLVDSFHFDNPCARVLNTPIVGPAAIFDSDCYSDNGGTPEYVALLSPTFDASLDTLVYLEWDQYFRDFTVSEVHVVAFNGVSVDTVYSATTSSPNPDFQSIDISSSVAGLSNAWVGFIWVGNFSWYWIIDNVLVYAPIADDVGVVAIDAPVTGCGLSSGESVTVQVVNFGLSAQGNIPVTYTVNGGGAVNDTIVATILPGDTLSYTFTVTTDFSTPGTYIIDSWTNLTGDSANANDSTLNYTVINPAITIYPYLEDFETFIPGTPGTLQNGWQNGTGDDMEWYVNAGATPSNNTGPANDHTTGAGNYMFTEASNPNFPLKTAFLLSPCFDISGLTNPYITFWYHMYGLDMGILYIDIDTGGTWIALDSIVGEQQTSDTDPWLVDTDRKSVV